LHAINPGGGGGGLFTLGVATPVTSSDARRRPRYTPSITTNTGDFRRSSNRCLNPGYLDYK
jgi:hypothetical protein